MGAFRATSALFFASHMTALCLAVGPSNSSTFSHLPSFLVIDGKRTSHCPSIKVFANSMQASLTAEETLSGSTRAAGKRAADLRFSFWLKMELVNFLPER